MTDVPEPATDRQPTAESAALDADGSIPAAGDAPAAAAPAPASAPLIADDRPERAIGAAFVGGFALALLLKRLAR